MTTRMTIAILIAIAGGGMFAQTRHGMDGWNITYTTPAGWQTVQQQGRVAVFTSAAHPGAYLLVGAGRYSGDEQILADLATVGQSLNLVQASPVEPPHTVTMGGDRALVAGYAGKTRSGQQVRSHFISRYSGHRTNLNVLALGTPAQMEGLRDAAERVAGSMAASEPTVNRQLMTALQGRWTYYDAGSSSSIAGSGSWSRSYQETVWLDGQGQFRFESNGHVSIDGATTAGGYSSGASDFSGNRDAGMWTAIGNTLIFEGRGGIVAVDVVLQGGRLIAGNRTWIRE